MAPDRFGELSPAVNTASVTGDSTESPEQVLDADPAVLLCIGTPDIEILKEISIDGGATFQDANDAASAPAGGAPTAFDIMNRVLSVAGPSRSGRRVSEWIGRAAHRTR